MPELINQQSFTVQYDGLFPNLEVASLYLTCLIIQFFFISNMIQGKNSPSNKIISIPFIVFY